MAGAGYKLFNTGDVLTAAQVNTYLQEQVVMRFATTAARTTALSGVLAEGMMSYIDATDTVEVYNGSAWVSVGSTGDITGVTAGTGISGGGTSGDVTITNSMATAIDAKGDLVVGTGADAFSRLAVGSNNQVLTVDSTTATGLKWAAAAGGGKVLQVVQGTSSAESQSSSATFVDQGLSASITPSATSSKILALCSIAGTYKNVNDAASRIDIRLMRDSTVVVTARDMLYTNSALRLQTMNHPIVYLDSPSTTSAITYKTQFANPAAAGVVGVGNGNTVSTIVLMEIGA